MLSTTVSTTAAGLAGRDGELAAMRKRLEAPAPAQAVSATDPTLKRQLDDLASGAVGTRMRLDGQVAELTPSRPSWSDAPPSRNRRPTSSGRC